MASATAMIHEDAAGDEYDNLNDGYIVLKNTGSELVDIDWTLSDEAENVYTFLNYRWAGGIMTV